MKKIVSQILSLIMIFTLFSGVREVKAITNGEMQAVWITTVYNKDWPTAKNDVQEQKQEFINILDDVKAIGLNTIMFQVRPKGDALYKSKINPWSDVLTGTQGKDPGYDPLAFVIEEAHKRGIKVHAWLNPYRVTTSGTDLNVLADNSFAKKNPNTVMTDGKSLVYNPGLPEVRQHIVDTVAEIVSNYSVDGIHFDDYFYPSKDVNDEAAYNQYGNGMNKDDFRRDSVNKMVQAVYNKVKDIKSNVDFGISPRGIWKNAGSDSTGSDTNGAQSYYDIYADTRTWIKNGWLDYVVPQIYWPIGFKAADYSKLVPWWSNEVKGTNIDLYIGHGIYKPEISKEIDKQINLNRQYEQVKGSVYYTYSDIKNNVSGVRDKIKESISVPVMKLIGSDRYDTAVKLSQSQFNATNTIVIANAWGLADGLTATPLATNLNAPILLTKVDELPMATKNEIKRLGAKKAIIVGGQAVVNTNVEGQLRNLGIETITRLGGSDRYQTALEIAKYIDVNCYPVEKIVVSNGYGEADALSIASVSGRDKMPIILGRNDKFDDNVYSWLRSKHLKNAYIIGGTSVLSDNIVKVTNSITTENILGNRLGGKDRYETNAMVIERFFGQNLEKVYASKGYELVDALTSGPIAALNEAPIVLCGDDLSSQQKSVLNGKTSNLIVEAGGGIPQTAINSLKLSLK